MQCWRLPSASPDPPSEPPAVFLLIHPHWQLGRECAQCPCWLSLRLTLLYNSVPSPALAQPPHSFRALLTPTPLPWAQGPRDLAGGKSASPSLTPRP